MYIQGIRPITPEMEAEVEAEYEVAMKRYNGVTMPAYEAAKVAYSLDLRVFYKWKHDNV